MVTAFGMMPPTNSKYRLNPFMAYPMDDATWTSASDDSSAQAVTAPRGDASTTRRRRAVRSRHHRSSTLSRLLILMAFMLTPRALREPSKPQSETDQQIRHH